MFADWQRLLPDEDYRFHMGLRPGDGAKFFAATAAGDAILCQRATPLREAPESCLLLPGSDKEESTLREGLSLMSEWNDAALAGAAEAGGILEPGWLTLSPDAGGELRVSAGAVCFPSSWSAGKVRPAGERSSQRRAGAQRRARRTH